MSTFPLENEIRFRVSDEMGIWNMKYFIYTKNMKNKENICHTALG